jgi:hypothetical protein
MMNETALESNFFNFFHVAVIYSMTLKHTVIKSFVNNNCIYSRNCNVLGYTHITIT